MSNQSLNKKKFLEVTESLRELIINDSFKVHLVKKRSNEKWGGAGVVIFEKEPKIQPKIRNIVISKHANEISWLFDTIKEICYRVGLIDTITKYSFFEMLAIKINSIQQDISSKDLLIELIMFLENLPENYFTGSPNDNETE
jgi:hypothetical protein